MAAELLRHLLDASGACATRRFVMRVNSKFWSVMGPVALSWFLLSGCAADGNVEESQTGGEEQLASHGEALTTGRSYCELSPATNASNYLKTGWLIRESGTPPSGYCYPPTYVGDDPNGLCPKGTPATYTPRADHCVRQPGNQLDDYDAVASINLGHCQPPSYPSRFGSGDWCVLGPVCPFGPQPVREVESPGTGVPATSQDLGHCGPATGTPPAVNQCVPVRLTTCCPPGFDLCPSLNKCLLQRSGLRCPA
jgi:hypothetical protein